MRVPFLEKILREERAEAIEGAPVAGIVERLNDLYGQRPYVEFCARDVGYLAKHPDVDPIAMRIQGKFLSVFDITEEQARNMLFKAAVAAEDLGQLIGAFLDDLDERG